ncbi:MAG: hypothetical protein IKD90_11735 [Clostridiales bacterium]|nr:hypothetical protein [Clostridiales bacterium]
MPALKEKSLRRFSRLDWLLLGIILLQFFMICFVNLTQLRHLTGYDSSASYYLTRKMWEQKSLFPSGFEHMRTYGWTSPVIPAFFLTYLTRDVFLSTGIANILFVLILIGSFTLLLRELKFTKTFVFLGIIFLLTPYAASYATNNALDYFSMTCINYCPYTSRLIFLALIATTYLRLFNHEKKPFTWLGVSVSLFLSFLMGMCAGISILLLIVTPFLLHAVVCAIQSRKLSVLKSASSIYTYALTASLLCGTLFASHVMHFASRSESITWVSAEQFFENLHGVAGSYFALTSALPFRSEVPVASKMGIAFGVMLCISLFFLAASILTIRQALKNKDFKAPLMPLVFLVFVDLLIFLFADLRLSTSLTESRYLIPVLVVFFILSCDYLRVHFTERKATLKKAGLPLLILAFLFSNALSYYSLFHHRLNERKYEQIDSIVSTTGTKLVYAYGEETDVDFRILRVMDPDHTYHLISEDVSYVETFTDSTELLTAEDYPLGVCLLTTKESFERLPLAVYSLFYEVGSTDEYTIYYSSSNPFSQAYLSNPDKTYSPDIHVIDENSPVTGRVSS